MTLASIRSAFETFMQSALSPVPVFFDNVAADAVDAASEFVMLTVSFPELTIPIICQAESATDRILGNVQAVVYAPRNGGMKRLEELAIAAGQAFYQVPHQQVNPIIRVGGLASLVVPSGDAPYLAINVSAPFTARVE